MLDPSTFDYNQDALMNQKVHRVRVLNGAIVQDITYASPYGGKVPAYLIAPAQQAARAGLIFGHWGEGDREEFVEEATVLALQGIVSLCPDAPRRRPGAYKSRRSVAPIELQWIVDVRRGIDLLLRQFGLVPGQIGYVGHSYGASYGGTLAGIEPRIKASVLMAGWYAVSELTRTSMHPLLVEQRQNIPPDILDAYLISIAPLDAWHYISHAAPTRLFFQYARDDRSVSVEEGQHFFDLAGEPKKIGWYDNCGHELNAQARIDRVIWLAEQLGLAHPSTEVLDLLAQLPAPVPLEN